MLAHHGLLTQIFRCEVSRKQLFPHGVTSQGYNLARDYAVQSASFSFHALKALEQILQKFETENIEVLVLKGPALSQLLYSDVTARPFGDLDLLVPPTLALQAQEALREIGFVRAYPADWTTGQDHALVAFGKAANFIRPRDGLQIDLHWRQFSQWIAWEPPFEQLWLRRHFIDIPGFCSCYTLGPNDLLIFLCLHLGQDGWGKLKSIWDIYRFLQSRAPDWEALKRLSGARFALVEQAIQFVNFIFQKGNHLDCQQALASLERRLSDDTPPNHRLLAPRYWSCPTWESVARSIWPFITPAIDDIQCVALPRQLKFGYVPIRLCRLLYKLVSRNALEQSRYSSSDRIRAASL